MSYILEDLAIISAAILAAEQMISVPMAATAILCGIISGDIGLYFMGYIAREKTSLKQRITRHNRHQSLLKAIDENLYVNILLIRFVPGLRFICYTSCGLFKINLFRFTLGVTIATSLWVMVVFTFIYQLGSSSWLENSYWKWAIAPVAIAILYFSNRRYMHYTEKA